MELFHQTVSMKSVGNLTDFVRAHKLEPFDAAAAVSGLIDHFENLTAAHDAVLKARTQLAALEPIVAGCDEADRLQSSLDETTAEQQAIRYAAATVTLELLASEASDVARRLSAARAARDDARARVDALRTEQQGLRDARAGHAGGRVGTLEQARDRHTAERDERAKRHRTWTEALTAAEIDPLTDPADFPRIRAEAQNAQATVRADSERLREQLTDHEVEQRQLRDESADIRAELVSLRERPSSIPRELLALRRRLADATGTSEQRLPFVGELVQVKAHEDRWRGAAERVLHGFALSLIVSDTDYEPVARWVDSHHLGTRLVYHRVRADDRHQPGPPARGSLAAKLEVKDGPHAAWLASELAARAAHECVETLEEFRRVTRALTVSGQVKSGARHEKDDRRRVDDRTQYVLGWDNKAKQDALLERGTRVQDDLNRVSSAIGATREDLAAVTARADALTRALFVDDVRDIDWWSSARALHEAERELVLLVQASRELATIEERLAIVEGDVSLADAQRSEHERAIGALETRLADLEGLDRANRVVLDEADSASLAEAVTQAAAALRARDVERTDEVAAAVEAMRAELLERADSTRTRLATVARRTERAMDAFRRDHAAETTEMDASLDAADEYRRFHDRVARDDLPRFEADFKRYLNQNTIREIAGFQSRLTQQATQITDRIRTINGSLRDIDYNPDRFIRLDAVPTPLTEIREFRSQLRACTEGALGVEADELYSEEKFEQVQALIARFRGREGFAEHDRQWTARVTDVRNWFVFNASERWRETNEEHETYADSDGKSGGQKEKLAYTILAASLAYQFRLDAPGGSAKTFRFAVIDEAFGRGSDESTRFALRLFARLGLQLLVVTPLQKVHTIEPFVRRVGIVDNLGGRFSRLHNLTIEEYQRQRAAADLARSGTVAARRDPDA
ncbi:MAG: hypothetical protein HOP99_09090 [Dermatophilaceae bacterium]|nr:hypothetical protein [Dermatophilaceae bacterium]